MPSGQIWVKQGDRLPVLEVGLSYDDGSVIDLTGGAVQFQYRRVGATTIVGRSMTVTNPSGGIVQYAWITDDTATPGRYEAGFEITFADGKTLTVPTKSHVPMFVFDDIGAPDITDPGPTPVMTLVNALLRPRITPTGLINGTNTTFTLPETCITNSEEVYLNGTTRLKQTADYTLSGINLTLAVPPQTGDSLEIWYYVTP